MEALVAVLAVAISHGASASSSANIEPWQAINLIGAPLLAVLFLPPVIEDLWRWRTEKTDRD